MTWRTYQNGSSSLADIGNKVRSERAPHPRSGISDMLFSEACSAIRILILDGLKDLGVLALDLLYHLFGIRFQRPGEMDSGAQMFQQQSLYGNEIFIPGSPTNCQMNRQIYLHVFGNPQSSPRARDIDSLKKFRIF